MEIHLLTVNFFFRKDGVSPFQNWLETIKDRKTKAVLDSRLIRIRSGNLGESRSVGEGVLELKIDFGPGFRIYFARENDQIILLLLGGDKSRQNRDIKEAKKYLKEHKEKK